MSSSFLSPKFDYIRLIEGIKHLVFGDQFNSLLLFSSLDSNFFGPILQKISTSQAPNFYIPVEGMPNPILLRWLSYCILSFFGIKSDVDIFYLIQPKFYSTHSTYGIKLK